MRARVKEKRKTPRIQPFVAPCLVVDHARRIPAYVTDLSPRGARVACDGEPPLVGAAVVIEVRIGRKISRSRLPAVVKWARPGPRGIHLFGLTFEGVAGEEQRHLEAVVEEFRRRAAQIE